MVNAEVAATNKQVGQSFPLGATVYSDGANFSVFSKNATEIDLLLFDTVDDAQPARVISFMSGMVSSGMTFAGSSEVSGNPSN